MSEVATRRASDGVIISAPWTYSGSAQRIFGLRRRSNSPAVKAAATALAVVLVIPAWALVTCRYVLWALWRGRQAEGEATITKTMLEVDPGRVTLLQPENTDPANTQH